MGQRRKISVFGGTLVRVAPDQWVWSDGTPEPRVRDLSPSAHYNFRCRQRYEGSTCTTYVEVLLSVAHRERDVLGWVLAGVEQGRYEQGWSGDHMGPLMITEEGLARMRVEPGEDPLLGHEPILHRRAIPRVALVPVAEWDAWAAEHPYGATWLAADEPAIFARARALGWQAPE
jgi:hypothetical protein